VTDVIDRPPAEATAPVRTPPLQRPLASYYLLLGSAGLLLFLGLVMVFSASSVRSYATYGSSSTIALKQGIFVGVGLPIAYVASRMPVRFWRSVALPGMVVVVAGLLAVLTPLGKEVDGTQGWIPLPGGFNIQPGEAAKLALALWGATCSCASRSCCAGGATCSCHWCPGPASSPR
jgi:cell division protein FtsW